VTVPRPPIISRADWGARPPKSSYTGQAYTGWSYHHTASRGVVRDLDGDIGWMQDMQNFHMDGRGWNDIAGNFEISRAGRIFEARPLDVVAAITYGHPVGGVEHEGYFHPDENENPADYHDQWNASVWLDAWVCDQYGWDPDDAVLGHRQYAGNSTACPGDLWIANRDAYIRAIRAFTVAVPQPPPPPSEDDMPQPIIGTPPAEYGFFVTAGQTIHLKEATGPTNDGGKAPIQVNVWHTPAGAAGLNLTAGKPLAAWEHREVKPPGDGFVNVNAPGPVYVWAQ
jgi:N-acetylmuramoyl-L-alanine amidase